MRHIDADALQKRHIYECARDCEICPFDDYKESKCLLIDEAPTIDAAPVHAYWEQLFACDMYGGNQDDWNSLQQCGIKCSKCGQDFGIEYDWFRYCPNCGAYMGLEVE